MQFFFFWRRSKIIPSVGKEDNEIKFNPMPDLDVEVIVATRVKEHKVMIDISFYSFRSTDYFLLIFELDYFQKDQ